MIRFIINSQGYWDPYSSYLRITVNITNDQAVFGEPATAADLAGTATAGNATQLDNSASSLIQTLSFIQNGVEIERIDRYEVLASILNDMFYSREQRIQRAHEGFGSGLGETHRSIAHIQTQRNYATLASTGNEMVDKAAGFLSATCTQMGGPQIDCYGSDIIPAAAAACISATILTPSPYFDGCNEPILFGVSTTKPPDNTNIYTYTFCIPIISGIFGVLVPSDEIKYIPMQFFPNLEMNFRLNPYAFHALNPGTGFGRNFQVTQCELFVNIIHFAPEINMSIAEMVKRDGLMMHTCSYYYGPAQMVQAGANMETYPINMSFKSLRSILWCFIPVTYRNYPYVRELRRKALNLQSAQVRIGGDTIPTFPIGNLGGSTDSSSPDTNADFLVNLYKAFGRLHDTVNDSLINSYTFCCGNTLTLGDYNQQLAAMGDGQEWPTLVRGYQIPQGAFFQKGANSVINRTNNSLISCPNATGAWSNSYYFAPRNRNNFLINQIVPRACYGIDLDTITSDDSVISGVNTLVNKPFELLLTGMNNTPEAVELNMFLYYDMVIMIDKDFTVKYLGRGG
jgi:hypothetical protein